MNEIVKFLNNIEPLIEDYLINETNKNVLINNFSRIVKAISKNEDNIQAAIKQNNKVHRNLLYYLGFCIKTSTDLNEENYALFENIALKYIENSNIVETQEGIAYFLLSFFNIYLFE